MKLPWRERVEIAGGRAVLYLGDNREVWPALNVRPDAVISDPPYGIAAAGATVTGGKRQWPLFRAGILGTVDQADAAFTQAMSAAADAVVIWGGQFFPLQPARGWLVWNKILRNWSASEAELAWTNLDQPVRVYDYSHGQLANEGKEHPTQKPLPLMLWCLDQAKVAPGAIAADPFMGSGTTGVACMRRGCRFVGIEIDEGYFRAACRRIAEAARQPDLLIPETAA